MDKYEYKLRSDEIRTLIDKGEYSAAVKLADSIDWRRVKSVQMLTIVSDLYKISRRYEDSRDILLLAYDRSPGSRSILYSLCELAVKMEDIVQAVEYYKEFVVAAPKDNGRYVLQYKLYEAQEVSLEERIEVLEELKRRDYTEKWAYELAYLYHRVGLGTKCVEECDELILWFGDGKYVVKAMELKMLHEPLTGAQQGKYNKRNGSKEDMGESFDNEDPEEAVMPIQIKPTDIIHAQTQELPGEDLDNIQVKTMDVGQYNTINLQQALAESMKEIMDEEKPFGDLPEEPTVQADTTSELDSIRETIMAPLFEETAELPKVEISREPSEFVTETVSDATAYLPIGETALVPDAKEIKFAEDEEFAEPEEANTGNFVESQNEPEEDLNVTKRLDSLEGFAGIKKVIMPDNRIILNSVVIQDNPIEETDEIEELEEIEDSNAGEMRIRNNKSEFDNVLAQEYDGQISLVVPDADTIEKQITGQMSIEDILAEWERIKAASDDKRRKEVTQRVLQQTGAMFTDFDELSKTGPLADLELLEEELGKGSKLSETEQLALALTGPIDFAEVNDAISEDDEKDAIKKPINQSTDKQVRYMTMAERDLFGSFAQSDSIRHQIVQTIDTISLASYTGNILITGDDTTGTLKLAKSFIKNVQLTDDNFTGKAAKIDGKTLDKKDIGNTIRQLENSALIVEKAGGLTDESLQKLVKELENNSKGIIIILEDKKAEIDRLISKQPALTTNFNARIDMDELDNDSLVNYAKEYAKEQAYSIDELGILALYTRIGDMQTSEHAVTILDVKGIVDDAIYHADRKNLSHLMDILVAKRYDDNDMIILREKDFIG